MEDSLTLFWKTAIEQLNPHLKISGCFIVIQLIKTVWTYILAIWALHNQHLHKDGGQLSLPNYHQAVQTIYELKSWLPQEAQDALFQRPLDQMLEQPPAFLHLWIKRSQCYIQQQLKAAQKCTKLKTPDIHSFFRRPNPSADDLQPL